MVTAKFICTSKTETESGKSIRFEAVTSSSDVNKRFFKWTPFGHIEMGILNPEADKQFEVGKEYYVNFEEAENPLK